jgi:putative ABC transport system permease protein
MRLLPWEYGVRNLGRSRARLFLSVFGAALVVLLVLSAGAFVRGMAHSLRVTGGPQNIILLGAGSEESFERSEISPAVPALVQASVSGIRQRLGEWYVSPEVFLQSSIRLSRGDESSVQMLVRGVTPAAFLVHSQARIIDGKIPEPARDQILVGSQAARRMGVDPSRLALGQQLFFDDRAWTISGKFEAPGTVMESEIWAPLTDLQIAAKRENLSCVVLTPDAAEFDDIDAFAKRRLDLELVAIRESDYYARLNAFFAPIQAMVWATVGLIALGGLLGGLNTMYAAFASRVRETATLQAIGFSRAAIVVSLVQESLLATSIGGLIACALGTLLLDGIHVQFSIGIFGLAVDSKVLAGALLAAVFLGLIGALPPAWRCLRLQIAQALKSD